MHSVTNERLKHQCSYFSPACNFAYGNAKDLWKEIEVPPSYTAAELSSLSPEVLKTVEATLDGLNASLRELSLEIHSRSSKCIVRRAFDCKTRSSRNNVRGEVSPAGE